LILSTCNGALARWRGGISNIAILPDVFLALALLALLISKRRPDVGSVLTGPVVAYILLGSLQFFNPNVTSPLAALLGWRALIYPTGAFFIALLLLEQPSDFHRFMRFAFALSLLIALYTFKQLYFGLTPTEYDWVCGEWGRNPWSLVDPNAPGTQVRYLSLTIGPVMLGVYAGMLMLVGVYYYLTAPTRWRRWAIGLLEILLFANVLLTQVRSTWFGLLIGGLGLCLVQSPGLFKKLMGPALIGGGLLLTLNLLAPHVDIPLVGRILTLKNLREDPNFQGRINGTRILWHQIWERPWGYGLGTTGAVQSRLRTRWGTTGAKEVRHWVDSDYATIGLCLGVPGLLAFLVLMGRTTRRAWSWASEIKGSEALLVRCLWAALFCGWIASLGVGWIEAPPPTFYHWFFLGTLAKLLTLNNQSIRPMGGYPDHGS